MRDVHQIMQSDVTIITPDTSAQAVAALMQAKNIGFLQVCEDRRPIGVVTDRDIVLRVMCRTGFGADMAVGQIMSKPVISCRADDSISYGAGIMGDYQIRRLIVCDDGGQIVGILSLGDIARDVCEKTAGEALGEIVEFR